MRERVGESESDWSRVLECVRVLVCVRARVPPGAGTSPGVVQVPKRAGDVPGQSARAFAPVQAGFDCGGEIV